MTAERAAGQQPEHRPSPVPVDEQVAAEGRLASRLRHSSPCERVSLYGEAYDAIYEMHLSRSGPDILDQTFGSAPGHVGLLKKLTRPGAHVLEIGCGTGYLAIELARLGRRVTAADVSQVALARAAHYGAGLAGLELRLLEGVTLPFPDASFDVAYSVEVVEHLHPDDIPLHLREVHRVLKPAGRYWLLTPSALFSRSLHERFGTTGEPIDDVHLHEWTYRELVPTLRREGFRRVRSPWNNQILHRLPLLPAQVPLLGEALVSRTSRNPLLARLFGVLSCSLVASKPA